MSLACSQEVWHDDAMPEEHRFSDVLKSIGYAREQVEQFSKVKLPFRLKPHQVEALHCGLYWNRYGLYDEARTGKTIVMQLLAIFFAHYKQKTLFLMPPVLFTQFEREFSRIEGHGLSVEVLSGEHWRKRGKIEDYAVNPKKAPDVLIMTRELFAGPFGKKRKLVNYTNDVLLSRAYNRLTWDECHLGTQDETSVIFKAVEKFINLEEGRGLVLSTGTPIISKLKSAYPHIRLKTPDRYKSRRHFDAEHVIYQTRNIRVEATPSNPLGVRRIPTIVGYSSTDLLTKNLYANSHRARKFEVLDMETPNVQVVPIELDSSHMSLYAKVLKEKLLEIEGDLIDLRQAAQLRMTALRLITSPEFVGRTVKKNNVIEGTKTLIEGVGIEDNKVVLFANFNSSVEFLLKKFNEYNPVAIYGGNSGIKNRESLKIFEEEEKCRLIVINPQAGGVGITLGHISQTAIFVEPVSAPAYFDQAASRIMLSGQKEPVSVYILEILNTLSPKAIDLMLGRSQEISEVLLDKRTLLDSLISKGKD